MLKYTTMFELIAPLRDTMMFDLEKLIDNEEEWWKLTKGMTDCNVKTEDEGQAGSINTVYGAMTLHGNSDISKQIILQFLEEGAIDMVCLVTSLDHERCDVIRAKNNLKKGEYSNCYKPAYEAIYGVFEETDLQPEINEQPRRPDIVGQPEKLYTPAQPQEQNNKARLLLNNN